MIFETFWSRETHPFNVVNEGEGIVVSAVERLLGTGDVDAILQPAPIGQCWEIAGFDDEGDAEGVEGPSISFWRFYRSADGGAWEEIRYYWINSNTPYSVTTPIHNPTTTKEMKRHMARQARTDEERQIVKAAVNQEYLGHLCVGGPNCDEASA
jgi:hypothetical protein